MFMPCTCDSKTCVALIHLGTCDFVFYHTQDIKKAERLATETGFEGFAMAYKMCANCKWLCAK